jgi:hypothetical protein
MLQYEYKRGIDLEQDNLDSLGHDGWQLVSVVTVPRLIISQRDSYPAHQKSGAEVREALVFYFTRTKRG